MLEVSGDEFPEWVEPQRAAEFLGVSKSLLASLRRTGDGPRSVAPSKRKLLHAVSELQRWVAPQTRGSNPGGHS